MNWIVQGRAVWKFDDHFNADLIAGSRCIGERDANVLREACLANFGPEFAQRVKTGDVMMAGRNFGYGNPHAEGIISLRAIGISMLIAESFYPLWYRLAIFHGFPILSCKDVSGAVSVGDKLKVDIKSGEIDNLTTRLRIDAEPMPDVLAQILEAGGLVAYLRSREALA